MKKSHLQVFFIVLLALDLGFSFIQHYHRPLDGDISTIVLGYPEVRHDPFGLSVLLENKIYGGTNRFFAHWMMSSYFQTIPFAFQQLVSPAESIYLTSALAKTLIQASIIWLLSSMISGTKKIYDLKLLSAAILVAPLFQTEGYNQYMGVISQSITYTFFYALPSCLLLLFLFPFHKRLLNGPWIKIGFSESLFLFVLCFILCLGGPLTPAIILIGFPLIVLHRLINNFSSFSSPSAIQNITSGFNKIPRQLLFFCTLACILSMYSLYIGRNNAENFFHSMSLPERYTRLPLGLFYLFTSKLGMPLLLIAITCNLILINREPENSSSKKIITQSKWISAFSFIYIMILPLGGYREYREYIVRVDTFLPVLLCMFYVYGISTLHLINRPFLKFKSIYVGCVFVFLIIFMVADKNISNANDCERNAISELSSSTEKIVLLKSTCTVMSWHIMTDYNNSKLNCELLKRWNILKDEKLYYQNKNSDSKSE